MLPTLTLVLFCTAQNKAPFSILLLLLSFAFVFVVVVCRLMPPFEPAYKTYFERNYKGVLFV